ncbi:MAG: hypothetical protein OXI01_04855 [Albidovulum sp.]|nr:hypothetical protein [Albidovulum sp.]
MDDGSGQSRKNAANRQDPALLNRQRQKASARETIEEYSLLSVRPKAGISMEQTVTNINLAMIFDDGANWMQAFEEFARRISPIGMSPRRAVKP